MILHTPHYPINKSIPGFSVFRNHKRIESIESYWMEIANLNVEKALHGSEAIPIVDKKTNIVTSFQRVYDSVELPDDPRTRTIKVAISFQVHSYGNFAVIRNALEKPKTEKEASERSDKDASNN